MSRLSPSHVRSETRRRERRSLGNLGQAHTEPWVRLEKALECYEQALAIAREDWRQKGEGTHLGNLGTAHYALGETRKALECHEQALAIAREIGDRRGEGTHLGNLGIAHYALGETRKALECHEQALAIAREMGDRTGEGDALCSSALALWALEHPDEAKSRMTEAEGVFTCTQRREDAAKATRLLLEWSRQRD